MKRLRENSEGEGLRDAGERGTDLSCCLSSYAAGLPSLHWHNTADLLRVQAA